MMLLDNKKNANITANKVSSLLLSYLLFTVFTLNRVDAVDETVKKCYEDIVCPFSLFNPGCIFSKCRERTFKLHLPPTVSSSDDGTNKKKFPLVLNLHALASNADFQQIYSDFDKVADEEGIIVAYPQGITAALVGAVPDISPIEGPVFSWNAGGCCASLIDVQNPGIVDDIAFLRGMVEYIKNEMSQKYNFELDTERIYATGMSNGGFMTNRIGCEMSNVVAAIAPVAGPLMENSGPTLVFKANLFKCDPKKPVPVLHFHNEKDLIVPFDGNFLLGFPPIKSSITRWREINGIGNVEPVQNKPDQYTECFHYSPNTNSSVSLCVINTPFATAAGSNHCWPGRSRDELGCGNEVGNQYIWDFLKKYTLSGGYVGDLVETSKDEVPSTVFENEEL